jgi:hypothetical protein
MRTFTVVVNKRRFDTHVNRRKIYGDDSNRQTFGIPNDESWKIVGTPGITLQDILGTLEDNVILR